MVTQTLLEEALRLNAEDRSLLADVLLRRLDNPDPELGQVWQEEALRCLLEDFPYKLLYVARGDEIIILPSPISIAPRITG